MSGPPTPIDSLTQDVLRARAARYAKAPVTDVASRSLGDFIGCRIAGMTVALPMNLVEEFAALTAFTPLPGIAGMLGVTQLRGEFLGVMDVGRLLLASPSSTGDLIVVLKASAGRIAARAEEVLGKRTILESDLVSDSQIVLPSSLFVAMTRELWAVVDSARFIRALDHVGTPGQAEA